MEQMASIEFFLVPTATFRLLFVFVVLSYARRRILHFQVTEHPSQEWIMQQMREAFPWDHGCGYLLRDRDAIYGGDWTAMTKGLGMEDVISAPRSPRQNPYVERLIAVMRRHSPRVTHFCAVRVTHTKNAVATENPLVSS